MRSFKSFFVFISVLFLSTNLFAQTDSLFYKNQLQFHLYGGYSLSYVNFVTSKSALRWHVDLSLSRSNNNNDDGYINESTQSNQNTNSRQILKDESNNSSTSVSLGFDYLIYMLNKEKISIFIGGGPGLNYNYGSTTNEHNYVETNNSVTSNNKYDNASESWKLGVRGVFGVQVKISESLSLIGEYGLFATYSWDKYENTQENWYSTSHSKTKTTEDGNTWEYGISSLKLGVAYHF